MAAIVGQNAGQSLMFEGLGTFTLLASAPVAGLYQVQGNISLPLLRDGPGPSQYAGGAGPSSVQATVKNNGSNVMVGIAGATGFSTQVTLAAGDALTVVLSSAATEDVGTNVIKTTATVSLI